MNTLEEILTATHQSRHQIARNYASLSNEMNVALQLRNSVRRQPWSWMGGALLTGMVVSFLKKPSSPLSYKKETTLVQQPSSILKRAASLPTLFLGEKTVALAAGSCFRFLFPLVRPMIVEYITRKLSPTHQEERPSPSH